MDVEEWEVPTAAAKDLVRRMLALDPAERIDMAGILAHPWLVDGSAEDEAAQRQMGQNYKSRIKGLVFRNKLKRFFMSNNIEAGLLTNSKDAAEFYFSQFDTDRDGIIDFEAMVIRARLIIYITAVIYALLMSLHRRAKASNALSS